jgi:hypothetical protein
MWNNKYKTFRGNQRFFRVGLSHDSLANHYTANFAMIQHHNWNLTDIDNMLPFERLIYVDMLVDHVNRENEKLEQSKKGN